MAGCNHKVTEAPGHRWHLCNNRFRKRWSHNGARPHWDMAVRETTAIQRGAGYPGWRQEMANQPGVGCWHISSSLQ